MKQWGFFYDEPKTKPYQHLKDWMNEVKHLIWPLLFFIILLFVLLLFILFKQ